ncbi:hypothetical protein ILYODFUR_022187 [Ilyodon furcidens]|uniref:Uncharacterized protein n=1 Tax=Ilyodon furcidens TaxID=33524 RepID=A0ABV0TXX0_9TELE
MYKFHVNPQCVSVSLLNLQNAPLVELQTDRAAGVHEGLKRLFETSICFKHPNTKLDVLVCTKISCKHQDPCLRQHNVTFKFFLKDFEPSYVNSFKYLLDRFSSETGTKRDLFWLGTAEQ